MAFNKQLRRREACLFKCVPDLWGRKEGSTWEWRVMYCSQGWLACTTLQLHERACISKSCHQSKFESERPAMIYPAPAGSLFGYRDRLLFLMSNLPFQIEYARLFGICFWASPQWSQVYYLFPRCFFIVYLCRTWLIQVPSKPNRQTTFARKKKITSSMIHQNHVHGQNVIWEVNTGC